VKSGELKYHIEREIGKISNLIDKSNLSSAKEAIRVSLAELCAPLKIAIVGRTKAGKSTLMNAILGISILPTGSAVTTYNVNVMRHVSRAPHKRECVIAHLKDGKSITTALDDLSNLTDCRKPDPNNLRDRIAWAEVYIDNDELQNIDIIDTPGLDSVKETDSENTESLFKDDSRKPNILIFVVQKDFLDSDVIHARKCLQAISGEGHRINGLSAITAYNHSDQIVQKEWKKDYKSEAQSTIDNSRKAHPEFRACFSKGFPIAAVFAAASYALTEEDFAVLKEISKCSFAEKFWHKYDMRSFDKMSERDPELIEIFKTQEFGKSMISRLGLDAMQYSVWWLINNPDSIKHDLELALQGYSNVPELSRYVFDEHFCKLTLFFKAISVIPNLRKQIVSILNATYNPIDLKLGNQALLICQELEKYLHSHYSFLSVMRDYYDCEDYFDDEEWGNAAKCMSICLDDKPIIEDVLSQKKYWGNKIEFYKLLDSHSELEAASKLLNALEHHEC